MSIGSAVSAVRVRPEHAITYLDDRGPLRIRTYPRCPFPREYEEWELGRLGRMVLPKSMTKREWDFLMQWLDLTRDGIVVEP